MQNDTYSYPTGAERTILILTAIIASLLQLIDTSIVNVSLREISGSIGATTTEIAWTVTAYAISNVIMIPLSGMLSDYFGRKNYFTFSIALFTIASFFCGISNDLWTLVFWRFIQGLGGGALLTTSQTIIVEAFPPSKVSMANAIFGMGVILGPTVGPSLGGFLTDNFSWHWIFFVNVPIGLLAAFLSWTYVHNRKDAKKPPSIDWGGIALLVISIGSLQYVLEEGTSQDWFDSSEIVLLSLVALAGLIGFIWWEWKSKAPAVNIRLLKSWNLAIGAVLNLVLGMILLATVFVFPLFVQIGLGWTATQTGNFMIPGALASGVSIALVGRLLTEGYNPKAIMITGILMIFVFSFMMSFSSPDSSQSEFFWPFILRGLGMGFMLSPILTLSIQGFRGSELAQAAGLTNMIRQLGGAIGIALMNVFLTSRNAFNDSNLLQNITIYSQTAQERIVAFTQNFISAGYDKVNAEQMAYTVLDRMLFKQESLVSYTNVFWLVGVSALVCLPLVFLIRNNKKAAVEAVDMIHE